MPKHSKLKIIKRVVLARRALQWAIGVFGFVPVSAGLFGVIIGPGMIADTAATPSMDSHFRYLSGLLLGIGLAFWSLIPGIERNTRMFQLLTAIVFIGGLARLYSYIVVGAPDAPMLFGLTMELIVTPLLAVCQYAVASNED